MELKTRFQILVEYLSSIKKKSLAFLMQQRSLAFFRLWLCENFIIQVSQTEMSFIFKTLFKNLVHSVVSRCSSALSNIASVSLEFNRIQIQWGL